MKGLVGIVLMAVLATTSVAAQEPVRLPAQRLAEAVPPAGTMPTLLQDIGLDQRLNEPVPLKLELRDEQGRDVLLGDYFGKRPVILTLVYYECPMLCTQVLNGLASALSRDELLGGQGVRHRHRQLRSGRDAGAGAGQEGGVHRAVQARRGEAAAGIS